MVGRNRLTCAVSHFLRNLLLAAVLAPAIAICLNSLILNVILHAVLVETISYLKLLNTACNHSNHLKNIFCIHKELDLVLGINGLVSKETVMLHQWRSEKKIGFIYGVDKVNLISVG